MKNEKTRAILSLVFNAVIVCEIVVMLCMGIASGDNLNSVKGHEVGANFFTAFTADSNILMGLCAAVRLFTDIRVLRDPAYTPPVWTDRLYHIGTSALALTFTVVVVFLSPQMELMGIGYFALFRGTNFFHHLINPLLAMACFFLLDKRRRLPVRQAWPGFVPAFIYGIVYLLCVVVFRVWPDIYNFTLGGRYALVPLVMLAVYALSYGLACAAAALHNIKIHERDRTS